MKRIIAILALFLCGCSFSEKKPIVADLAITNVNVICAEGNSIQFDRTVLITKDTITGIVKSSKVLVSSNTKIIDGKGKYLIPGLWDMHVHGSADTTFCQLMIANGITSVREMFTTRGNFNYYKNWQRKTERNEITGPHFYIPYSTFSPYQPWFGGDLISTKEEAVKFVQEAKQKGADFIKIFDLYDKDVILTLLAEAKKQGILVAGHCPLNLNYAEAVDGGLSTIEHLYGILFSTSSKEDSIRNRMVKESQLNPKSMDDFCRQFYFVLPEDLYLTYNEAKALKLFKHIKERGCYICPTFSVFKNLQDAIDTAIITPEQKKYVSEDCYKYWSDLNGPFTSKLTANDFEPIRKNFNNRYELVRELNKQGVLIIAGTDESSGCAKSYSIQGFVLHDELSLLVKAGLSPIQVIQAATKNAASALKVIDKTGTIEIGKCADLVLLNANPLENISNTREIEAVIKSGNYFSRKDLDSLLYLVEKKVHH